jgi:AraC-like DNA-binding protein
MFSLVSFTFIAILLFSLTTFWLTFLVKGISVFNRVIRAAMVLVSANYLFMYIMLYLYRQDDLDRGHLIPFYLLYGPLLYFGIISLRDGVLSKQKVILHLLPFVLFSGVTVMQSYGWINIEEIVHVPMKFISFILLSISLIFYVTWSFLSDSFELSDEFRTERSLFIFAKILMIFVGVLSLTVFYNGMLDQGGLPVYFAQLLRYLSVFLYVLSNFIYLLNKLLYKPTKVSVPSLQHTIEMKKAKAVELPKYKHSALTDEQLIKYEQNLMHLIQENNLFLDRSLSLASLAQHLRMPKHHLTEVFSRRIKKSFNHFINTLRIYHAGRLLKDPDLDMKLEDLSEHSGFNSKVSFNRYFKIIYDCTPSQYRAKYRSQSQE